MTPHRQKPQLASAFSGVVAVSVLGLLGMTAPRHSPARLQQSARETLDTSLECPHSFRAVYTDSLGGKRVVTEVSVAGIRTNIPEYHDCQRMLDSTNDELGPLIGLYAAQWVDRLPALIAQASTNSGTATAVAAAEIYEWDGAGYLPLGLVPGFNCLYLYDTGPRGRTQWFAWTVPAPGDGSLCHAPMDTVTAAAHGHVLRAIQLPHTAYSGSSTPPNARWDWSSARGRHQYIGVKCGDEWCEVGHVRGFGSSASPCVGSLTLTTIPGIAVPGNWQRVLHIKGWYDQQRLAPAIGPHANATHINACIVPDPRLSQYDDAIFAHYRWLPVAYVDIPAGAGPSAEVTQYTTKYNFATGASALWICHRDRATCFAPGTDAEPPMPSAAPTCTNGDADWWAVIVPAAGPSKGFCIRRAPYSASSMTGLIGSARFHWKKNDETIWVSCALGCCEMETE